jgi:carboxymethylenebutenolidase
MRTICAATALLAGTLLLLPVGAGPARAGDDGPMPERVTFPSADRRTLLVGYLYKPAPMPAARVPAVVMMHGRSGAYSSRARGVYDASTLSMRHKAWGRLWAAAGYMAILVDGFAPRGHPAGFPPFSYDRRPKELSEVTVRPLDAYGALAYLRSRPDVIPDRIGLQGWSNGGSAALSAMHAEAPGIASPTPRTGFRAALAFYPGCRLGGRFDDEPFRPYAPVLVLHGTADEEVSHRRCEDLVERSRERGGNVEIELYPGATHSFDAPTRKRQSIEANADALNDAVARSLGFLARHLGSGSRQERRRWEATPFQ